MLIYESKEKFLLWDFMEGMRDLILRGGTGGMNEYNYVEIEFLGVFYLNIPTSFSGICISKLSEEDIQELPARVPRGAYGNFFRVTSAGMDFIIGSLSASAYYTKASGTLPSVRDSNIKMSDIEIIASSVDIQ